MRGKYATIFYIFFTLLFLGALALLFMRQPFIDYFRDEVGVENVEVVIRKSPPQSELINTDIFDSERLKRLSNQVTVFSWEDICGDSLDAPKACIEGNSNPFLRR